MSSPDYCIICKTGLSCKQNKRGGRKKISCDSSKSAVRYQPEGAVLGWTPAGCCAVRQQATLPSPAGASLASWSSFFSERGERQELTAQAGRCHGPQTVMLSKRIHGEQKYQRCCRLNASPSRDAPVLTRLLHLFNKDAGKAGGEHTGDLHRSPAVPGATPAGSLGGTGFSRCQQQAPVVGRFVFQLLLVLGLSPRTRLGCGYRFSRCFLGLGQIYKLLVSGMHPCGAHPAIAPTRAGADRASYERRGRKAAASAAAEPVLSRSAQSEAERLLCLGARPTSGSLGPAADSSRLPDLHRRAGFVLLQPCSQRLSSPKHCKGCVSFHC